MDSRISGMDERVIVQFSYAPLGEGVSVSPYVAKALKDVESSGIKFSLTPMVTILEASDVEEAFRVILKAHART